MFFFCVMKCLLCANAWTEEHRKILSNLFLASIACIASATWKWWCLWLMLAHHHIEALYSSNTRQINLDAYQQSHWIVDLRFYSSNACFCFPFHFVFFCPWCAHRRNTTTTKTVFILHFLYLLRWFDVLVSFMHTRAYSITIAHV